MEKKCKNCRHFYVTFEPATPNGCKLYGFKSKKMPSLVVKEQSEAACRGFSLKENLKKKKGLDLNDPSLW